MSRKRLCTALAGSAFLLAALGISAAAADWKLAVPTSEGLGFVNPNTPGAASVVMAGVVFGQVDDVVAVDGGARLLGGISAVGSGNETIMAYDTRTMQPTGTTSFGGSIYGVIPNQTVTLPDGKSVIIVAFDGNVNLIDIASGKAIGKPVALDATPVGADLTPDGNLVVGLRVDGETTAELSLVIAKANPVEVTKTIVLGKEKLSEEEVIYHLQVTAGAATVYGPNVAYIADLKSGKVKKVSPVYNKKALTPIGLSQDAKTLVCRLGDGATGIFAYDVASGKAKRVLMQDPTFAVGSEDGALIYVSSPTKSTIGVFDAATMAIKAGFTVPGLLGPMKILKDPKDSALPIPKSIGGNIVVLCDVVLGGAPDAKETFSTILQRQLAAEGYGIPVINSCQPDGLAQAFADDFENGVASYDPRIVVLEMGQGDILAAQAAATEALPEDVKADAKALALADAAAKAVQGVVPGLEASIVQALSLNLKVLLVCPSPLLQPIYDAAAATHKVPMVTGAKAAKDSVAAAYPTITALAAALVK